jgi:hypothetical protein
VQGACSSSQGSTNLQFNSPNAVIFQIYDNATCDSILENNPSIFSTPFVPSTGNIGEFQLCYGALTQKGTTNFVLTQELGSQYYFSSGIVIPVFSFSPVPPYDSNEIGVPSLYSPLNNFSEEGISGVVVNVTQNNPDYTQLTLDSPVSGGGEMSFSSGYEFKLVFSSNVSSTVTLFFGNSCSQTGPISYTPSNTPLGLTIFSPCSTAFNSLSIDVQPVSTGQTQPVFHYEFNLTAQQPTYIQPQVRGVLYNQCTVIPSLVSSGLVTNGSLTCSPIKCGSTSFILTDLQDRAFEALFGGTYNFFGFQSGLSYLQILNPNGEQISTSPSGILG